MIYFIIAVILFVIASIYLFNECKNEFLALLAIWAIGVATCLLLEASKNNRPQAIDVYRGKTTLKITYENNIPIDTVVVFKK